MLTKLITATVLLLSLASQAYAHLEKGVHAGTTNTGEHCSMTVGEQTFDGVRHPLNERVEVTVNGVLYKVGHPAVIDTVGFAGVTGFNHDAFQGIVGVAGGANGIYIVMSHEEGKEGPVQFTVIENSWNNKSDEKIVHCENLKFQSK